MGAESPAEGALATILGILLSDTGSYPTRRMGKQQGREKGDGLGRKDGRVDLEGDRRDTRGA